MISAFSHSFTGSIQKVDILSDILKDIDIDFRSDFVSYFWRAISVNEDFSSLDYLITEPFSEWLLVMLKLPEWIGFILQRYEKSSESFFAKTCILKIVEQNPSLIRKIPAKTLSLPIYEKLFQSRLSLVQKCVKTDASFLHLIDLIISDTRSLAYS